MTNEELTALLARIDNLSVRNEELKVLRKKVVGKKLADLAPKIKYLAMLQLLKTNKFTVAELAEAAGVSRQAYYQWKNRHGL